MLAILLAMGLSLGKSARQRIRTPLEGVRQLSEGWYRLEAGRRVEVQIPGTVTLDSGEALTLYYDGLNPTDAGLLLTTRGRSTGCGWTWGRSCSTPMTIPPSGAMNRCGPSWIATSFCPRRRGATPDSDL